MGRYRKKPVEINAVQFTGDNWDEMRDFCGTRKSRWNEDVLLQNFNPIGTFLTYEGDGVSAELWVAANDAWLGLVVGEWVIQYALGFYYPCKATQFAETYEEVVE